MRVEPIYVAAVRKLREALLAVDPQTTFDDQGYCIDPAANLVEELRLSEIAADFESGAGGELAGKSGHRILRLH